MDQNHQDLTAYKVDRDLADLTSQAQSLTLHEKVEFEKATIDLDALDKQLQEKRKAVADVILSLEGYKRVFAFAGQPPDQSVILFVEKDIQTLNEEIAAMCARYQTNLAELQEVV